MGAGIKETILHVAKSTRVFGEVQEKQSRSQIGEIRSIPCPQISATNPGARTDRTVSNPPDMEGHHSRFRATLLVSLITSFQALQSWAAPFQPGYRSGSVDYIADTNACYQDTINPITATTTCSEPSTYIKPAPQASDGPGHSEPNGAIIYEIGDGEYVFLTAI